jgi:hypothetical protein
MYYSRDFNSEFGITNKTYCGVAPKGRSIERPLLISGYASSSGFIGNDCKSTQRPIYYTRHVDDNFFIKKIKLRQK